MVVLPAAAVLLFVGRTWQRGYEARSAIAVGALAVAAVLLDQRALALIPVIVLGGLGPLWTRGTVARRYFGWLAQTAIIAVAAVLVWGAWAAGPG